MRRTRNTQERGIYRSQHMTIHHRGSLGIVFISAWMNHWCLRPLFCTYKATLDRGQPRCVYQYLPFVLVPCVLNIHLLDGYLTQYDLEQRRTGLTIAVYHYYAIFPIVGTLPRFTTFGMLMLLEVDTPQIMYTKNLSGAMNFSK